MSLKPTKKLSEAVSEAVKPSFRSLLKTVAPNLLRHSVLGTYFGYKAVGGKRLTENFHTADRKTANAKLREWIDDLNAVDPGNTDMTLAMLLERYQRARTAMSTSTLVGEAGRIAKFRASFPLPMNALACRVDTGHMAQWLAKVGEGKRASTRNQFRAFVRALFDFAVSVRAIPKNPFDPRICRKTKKDPITRLIPSEKEFQALVAEIRQPTWKKTVKGKRGGQRPLHMHESADFAEFLGLAGVGQAEAVGLQWSDIDFEADTIHFVRKKTKTPFSTPIFPWLRPLLQRLREAGGSGPVFAIKDVKKALGAACRRLGFAHFTQRGLRAMRIKRLWEAGVDVKIIAQWQGHRDGGKLIMSIYTEVFGSTSDSYERAQLAKAARMFAASETVVPFAQVG